MDERSSGRPGSDQPLVDSLELAQREGFLGPGPVAPHIAHARAFAAAMVEALGAPPVRLGDLGTGAGVPGLVLAFDWPFTATVLIEGSVRRAGHLRAAIVACGMEERVEVVPLRAEELGRRAGYRAGFDGVVARSFGRPGVAAECAAPLLRVGGVLVVSEPPDSASADRWPEGPLASLGMALEKVAELPFRMAVIRQFQTCPDRYPRRVGVPSKRPVF